METNVVPYNDMSVNETGCCPKFNPEGWDNQTLHFHDKPFLRADTRAAMHIPLNIGSVFTRVQKHMDDAGQTWDPENTIVLSKDLSPWKAEHYFAISEPIEGEENTTLSGDFITKLFEGPYRDAKHWDEEMRALARERGADSDDVYFYYTTCPKCAKTYGKNYVVGVARI